MRNRPLEECSDRLASWRFGRQERQVGKGRQVEALTLGEQSLGETIVIMADER